MKNIAEQLVAAAGARRRGEPEPPIRWRPGAWHWLADIAVEWFAEPVQVTGTELTVADYRRAVTLACFTATADDKGAEQVYGEAEQAGRLWHLCMALAVSIGNGMRADTPEGLAALRDMLVDLTAQEDQK